MQANWHLILNVLLLIGVVVAIGRLMKARRQSFSHLSYQPSLSMAEDKPFDDIIAVRKVNTSLQSEYDNDDNSSIKTTPVKKGKPAEEKITAVTPASTKSVMIFLLAKEDRHLAGYELLQTVLAAGLRFGEGQLFHRHQYSNGQGPVLCSLAAATASGVFDLQNIGAFSVRGLCLFMQASGNPTIDAERFSIMLETAKQLSEGLNTHLLDDQKQPLSNKSLARYQQLLNIEESYESSTS